MVPVAGGAAPAVECRHSGRPPLFPQRVTAAILGSVLIASSVALLRAAEPTPGRPHQDIVDLNNKARYAEAEVAARERLALVEASHGSDAPEVADVLDELVLSLWRQGKVKAGEAQGLAERAVRIRETSPASRPEDVALSLNMLAHVHSGLDDYAGARALYERALTLREKAHGPDQPGSARLLVNIGRMSAQLGEYPAARAAFQRSLDINRRTLAPGDPSLGLSLINLASLDFVAGDYDSARTGYEQALAILEKAHGTEHPHVGDVLMNLANVMYVTGDFPGALALYPRAIAVLRKTLGDGHDSLAHAMTNYGETLRATGHLAEARRSQEEALAIQRAALGPESPRLARTLTNLSAIEVEERRYEAARDHLREAAALVEAAFGPENANLIASLCGLADVLTRMGENAGAEAVVTRVRALATANLPAGHPRLAQIDQIEGHLRARAGDLEAARRLTGRALAERESRLGPFHPDTVESRAYLATLLWALGERAPALEAARVAGVDLDRSLRETIRALPEARALELAAHRTHPESVLFTGLLDDPDRRAAWLGACFDWTLRSRGLVLEEISARRRTALLGGTERGREALARLGRGSDRLAAVWIRGPDAGDPATFRTNLDRALRERDDAEAAFAALGPGVGRPRGSAPIDMNALAASMPEASVLIEVIRVGVRPSVAREDGAPTSERYVALRLDRAGASDFADLGEAGEVDGLVERWRAALERTIDDQAKGPGARALDAASAALARAVWDPIARLAGDARRILLAPDGSLHLVHFPALTLADGRFQIEAGQAIHLLGSGRDLLQDAAPAGLDGAPTTLLALGGVAYSPGVAATMRGVTNCASLGDRSWKPLPESRREVDGVRHLFAGRGETLALTGAAATESRLRSEAPRHQLLHLATHGFFLDDSCGAAAPNPLLLSGLVLASPAGTATPAGAAEPGADDGLLTAEEVAALDLSAVRLAVLSACNTGAGRVTAGEGVFGLRRALEIAGTRSVVMSLWPVPDRQGRQWMTSFYEAWLGGEPVYDAARRASLERLDALRKREAPVHPYYWGGFVTAGDWRAAVPASKPR